jgi:hypothetical protein
MNTPTTKTLIATAQLLLPKVQSDSLRGMPRAIAKFLSEHDAVEEGPWRIGQKRKVDCRNDEPKRLKIAVDALLEKETPKTVANVVDEWRYLVRPKQAEVDAVLKHMRVAEPDKTWSQTGADTIKASKHCPGPCGRRDYSQSTYKVTLQENGEWGADSERGSFAMGWQYRHGGEVHHGCVSCAQKLAICAHDTLINTAQIPLQELIEKQPQDKIAEVAKKLKQFYPVDDWLFSRAFLRSVLPHMDPDLPRVPRDLAIALGFHEDGAFRTDGDYRSAIKEVERKH